MAKLPAKIRNTLDRYLKELQRHNIPVQTAILFGSYAKGGQAQWSDIDIALVSDIFEGDRIADKDKIRSITLSVSSAIEVIPFSPEDFDREDPLVKEIIETGVRII